LRATAEPFTTDRWTALIVPAVAAVLAAAVALRLAERREFGAGLLPRRDTRNGRLRIRTAAGLAARLARASMLTWTVAVAAIGALFAAMGSGVVGQQRDGDVGGFLGAQLGDADPAAGYLSYCGTVVGIVVGAYAVLSVSAARHAERAGLTDIVLTTGVRRWAPLAAQTAVTAAGAAVVLAVTAGLVALITPAVIDGDHIAARAFLYTMGQWPAVAVLAGWTALLAGAAPRLMPLAWLPLAAGAVLALLGDLLGVPRRVQDLGIFRHVPDAATASPPTALLLLSGIGVVLCGVGLVGATHRDLVAG
jgi:ABC-2 type transport system permease protein